MNSDMVKSEKYGRLHFVYHFTIPLSRIKPILDVVLKQGVLRIFKHGLAGLYFRQRKCSRAETILLLISHQRPF